MTSNLPWVRRLAVVSVGLTFLLMILGAWVKATGSGLACPDWPACYGEALPPFPSVENSGTWDFDGDGVPEPIHYTQAQVLYEWGHRALATLIAIPVLAFAIVTLRSPGLRRELRAVAATAAVVLAFQGGLGALTVRLGNAPWATTLHMATAVVFFGLLLTGACMAFLAPRGRPEAPRPAAPHPAFAPSTAPVGYVFNDAPQGRFPGEEGPHGP